LDFGLWTLDFGLWTLDFGLWTLDFKFYKNKFGFSPDGSENPAVFSADCNLQQEMHWLKMP
jgi:hypothetical protein